MSDAAELIAAVRAKAAGTPYTVTETAQGFDLGLDIVNAHWYALFAKQGLSRTFVHHVKLDEPAKRFTITDDSRTVSWSKGVDGSMVPRMSLKGQRQWGTTYEFSTENVVALDDHGQVAKVVDYTFSSNEGRALITGPAKEAGWTQRMDVFTRIGLVFGLIGGVGAVIAVVLLLFFGQH